MSTTRDFLRITPGMLDGVKPGDRLFAAQITTDNPEPFTRDITWCEVAHVDDAEILAHPIEHGVLLTDEDIRFDAFIGQGIEVPEHLRIHGFGILAIDEGPRFELNEKEQAVEAFHQRTNAAIAERDISADVLSAMRNGHAYLWRRYQNMIEPQNADIADKALQLALNLDTTIRILAPRRWMDFPLEMHGPVMRTMRNAHDFINDYWATNTTAEGRLALKCVNDLRVALTIAQHGPQSAKGMLPIKPADQAAIEQAMPVPEVTFCIQYAGPEQRFTSAEDAGAAFYRVPADNNCASAYVRTSTMYPQFYGKTLPEENAAREDAYHKELNTYAPHAEPFQNGFFQAMSQDIEQRLQGATELDEQTLSDLDVIAHFRPELARDLWRNAAPEHLAAPESISRLVEAKPAPAVSMRMS